MIARAYGAAIPRGGQTPLRSHHHPAPCPHLFAAVWEVESHLFDGTAYTLDDILRSVVAEGAWEEAESRSVHVEITYKPESPVDHVTYPAAAQALWEVEELSVTYCGCSYSVVIHESSSFYNQATEEDVKRNGGCYHAYEEGGESASASASAGSSSSGRHIRGVKY